MFRLFLAVVRRDLKLALRQKSDVLNISQFSIANELGVTVPKGYKRLVANQNYSDSEYEYGIKIDDEKLKYMLSSYGVKEVKNLPINYMDEFSFFETIKKLLNDNYWVICGFSYGMLYDDPELYDCGHVNLILNTIGDSKVVVYDPGPKNPGQKIIEEDNLYVAMRKHAGALTLIKFK